MHFSEDDLRAALQRKQPGENFTQRVMAAVEAAQGQRAVPSPRSLKFRWLEWPRMIRWAAAAAALVIVLSAGWTEHQEQIRKQEQARRETMRALQIATEKINLVMQRAMHSQEQD